MAYDVLEWQGAAVRDWPLSRRRASAYTDCTFAVWSRPPVAGALQLVAFAKAYSGLTDEEFKRIDRVIRQTTLEKFGPVRSVKPSFVFELGFEGINRSSRHKSGIAVRFPRMLRIRDDKPLFEADSVLTLEGLLAQRLRVFRSGDICSLAPLGRGGNTKTLTLSAQSLAGAWAFASHGSARRCCPMRGLSRWRVPGGGVRCRSARSRRRCPGTRCCCRPPRRSYRSARRAPRRGPIRPR